MTVNAPQPLPSQAGDAGTLARQLLRLVGPGRQAPDGSLAAADALAYGSSLADSRQMLLDIAAEAFPSLATDLLTEWEELFDLPVDDTLQDAERRLRLVGHTRALLGASPEAIESAVAAYSGSCTVYEVSAAGVWAVEPGVTQYLTTARRAVFRFTVVVPVADITNARRRAVLVGIISRMKPAHTTFTIANGAVLKVETADNLVELTALGG